MATKGPTKEEFVEALRQQGINNLDDLVDAILPETGGHRMVGSIVEPPNNASGLEHLATIFDTPWGRLSFAWAF